jgi:glycine/D-amino acid oxidase-like deaminating enzyme
MFCRSLGISLPQLRIIGTVARTAPGPKILDGQSHDRRIAIRRRQDGGYTVGYGRGGLRHPITPSTFRFASRFLPALRQEIGGMWPTVNGDFFRELATPVRWDLDRESPFEKQRVLNPAPSQGVLRKIRKNLNVVYPTLKNTEIVESWAGMIDTTPDIVPVIGEEDDLPGLHIATGLSGHGFGSGPGVGKAIAALVTGKDIGIDLTPFRRSRFYDGSPIRLVRTL